MANRILRLNAILRGDTDETSLFSDTQHIASLILVIVCVQDDEVADPKFTPRDSVELAWNTTAGDWVKSNALVVVI
jgi:hypothetical protein